MKTPNCIITIASFLPCQAGFIQTETLQGERESPAPSLCLGWKGRVKYRKYYLTVML